MLTKRLAVVYPFHSSEKTEPGGRGGGAKVCDSKNVCVLIFTCTWGGAETIP